MINIENILKEHKKWLIGNGGKRADLRGADLRRANLSGANLRMADLSEADLRMADLSEANLRRANLSGANLSWANLSWANLHMADLRRADLSMANLSEADLREADLSEANLRRADLSMANLSGANLSGANLSWANLRRADLREADLSEADLDAIVYDYNSIGIHPAPEGDLIGWGKKSGKIVKMLIPADAKRSCATTRKHRAEFVKVLKVYGGDETIVKNKYGTTIYKPGEIVRCHKWDDNRWNECSGGIHFFLTREEAEQW